ncbi:Pyrimidine-specific ribonucleoside hydrolase RihA [Paenibacillus konkukensis]|uniref:Pyrimidine-specific ribonucleoside hydrolase RihA n=1 Tax=Paenibacillus konkukensis TaxID=2020716 RepID=A0ABY4RMT7_9BACL|nr:nucleoside hydrolase [Paenibacillus konkukensis]UQZ83483.1 Pyrimidine-specific ribonucleoside hydrolase RihA [Paenibacillus konkukensis]
MRKLILDVDTGIDDALAIAYAAASPEIEFLGVTTTYGMAPVDCSVRNTLLVLEHLKCDVPVFRGAEAPLVRTRQYSGTFHGTDGLGNTAVREPERAAADMHAVDFIIAQAREHGRELTLVTTAPLTNLALAIRKAPDIVGRIGRVVTMGGAVATPGNASKFAEANIIIDPHAADLVFASELPITLVGLDVTRKTLLRQEEVERWREMNTPCSLLFAEFTEFYMQAYRKYHPYLKGCALHDPLAVGVAVHPELVHTIPMHIKVDLEEDALGRTTEDLHRESPDKPNTRVCMTVDAERFVSRFLSRVDQAFSR